uniref:Senescence regulator n=1 Tax=Kalanchoe fedtschenkoi TaxID=63787 RepID=A0A7N1A704_KALFE
MATRKAHVGRPSYRFLTGERESFTSSNDSLSELDEFDIWNSGPDPRRSAPGSRIVMKKGPPGNRGVADGSGGGSGSMQFTGSLPVSVPDWTKILREDGRRGKGGGGGWTEEDEDEEAENRIPPHEVVARRARSRRVASFSVHEGIGRTLKGRDLSRVRNSIWEKTGFQD